jgi:purine-binding chemotaxis protein CheW
MKSINHIPPNLPSEKIRKDEYLATDNPFGEEMQMYEVSSDILNQIFIRRAALIAMPIEEEEKGEQIELVLFRIGKELYGLDVQSILDIHPCTSITPLPRVPQWIAGLTNIGGHILAVLDLQPFLGLALPETQKEESPTTTYLIRISAQDIELALRVDEVLAIEVLPTSKIQEKTDVTRNLPPEFVRGVYDHNSAERPLVLILNLAYLLADPRLVIQEEVL